MSINLTVSRLFSIFCVVADEDKQNALPAELNGLPDVHYFHCHQERHFHLYFFTDYNPKQLVRTKEEAPVA